MRKKEKHRSRSGEYVEECEERRVKFFSKVGDSRFWRILLFSWMKNVKLNMVDFLGQYHKDRSRNRFSIVDLDDFQYLVLLFVKFDET